MRREYCPEDTSSSESDGSERVLAIRREYCSEDTSSSVSLLHAVLDKVIFVKLRRGSGKDWQGMAVKAKGLKA